MFKGGVKCYKKCIAFMLEPYTFGTEKLKLVVIGKVIKSGFFKGIESLLVDYL